MRLVRALGALGGLAWVLSLCAEAKADLDQDADALENGLAPRGQVQRQRPRLMSRGQVWPVLLSPRALAKTCTTVVILGVRDAVFSLRFRPGSTLPGRAEGDQARIISRAGLAEVTKCGEARRALGRLVVAMRSPRAVIETLVITSAQPPQTSTTLLPHRRPGPVQPTPSIGASPKVAPLARRLARTLATERARGGLQHVDQRRLKVDRQGSGQTAVELTPGCHRLMLMATSARGVDLDAQVHALDSSAPHNPLAEDSGPSADAKLRLCVGAKQLAVVRFRGARVGTVVVLVHARRKLARGLPAFWGAEAQARIAFRLADLPRRPLEQPPLFQSLGVAGSTLVPLSLQARHCYIAAATTVRGKSAALALAVKNGAHRHQARGSARWPAAAVSFCTGNEPTTTLEVEVRGRNSMWVAAVWSVGSLASQGEQA